MQIQVDFSNLERCEGFEERLSSGIRALFRRFPNAIPRFVKVTLKKGMDRNRVGRNFQGKIKFYGGRFHYLAVQRVASSIEEVVRLAEHELVRRIERKERETGMYPSSSFLSGR
ncbi:MAG: hypothetical protein H6617_10270 [Bdellovibrionaceae bacterium]|nr:hypothetical protein [Pseudobdellovibrionaceae bacterium]